MIHTTLAIVIVMYVSRARHRGALELRAKNHLTLFQCALNTETKTKGENIGLIFVGDGLLKMCL